MARGLGGRGSGPAAGAEAPVKRGTVHWVNLEPATPPEMGKLRPAVIVSNSVQNEHLDSVVVLPLSTRAGDIWPLRLPVEVAGLRPSWAVVPGVRQVARTRLHEEIGAVGAADLQRLTEAVHVYLAD